MAQTSLLEAYEKERKRFLDKTRMFEEEYEKRLREVMAKL
jgi:hypothetical protein